MLWVLKPLSGSVHMRNALYAKCDIARTQTLGAAMCQVLRLTPITYCNALTYKSCVLESRVQEQHT